MPFSLKTYSLSGLYPGMTVGETIITPSGRVILEENNVLTDTTIRLLELWDINKVAIRIAEPELNADGFSAENKDFNKIHSEIVEAIKNAFEKIRYLKEVPMEHFETLAQRCLDHLVLSAGVVQHLLSIKRTDDYTFRHSVNVSVVSGVIGKWLGLGRKEILELVLAGLLHDIGKIKIPLEILNKPGKLTDAEMDIMKSHAAQGFEIVKDNYNLPEAVLLGIKQHHERIDGSGYPGGVSDDEIYNTAKIIAVADVHDAMTSNRVYRDAVSPFSVIAELSAAMFNKLSPDICSVFLHNFSHSLIGCNVKLSNGLVAKVIYINRGDLEKPLLQTDGGSYVNLLEKKDLRIVEIVNT